MIGSLTLDQLRVLVTIADSGSFSAAGRELRRAQSAISQAVANLEVIPKPPPPPDASGSGAGRPGAVGARKRCSLRRRCG